MKKFWICNWVYVCGIQRADIKRSQQLLHKMKKPNRERGASVMKPLCSTTPAMAQVPERNKPPVFTGQFFCVSLPRIQSCGARACVHLSGHSLIYSLNLCRVTGLCQDFYLQKELGPVFLDLRPGSGWKTTESTCN